MYILEQIKLIEFVRLLELEVGSLVWLSWTLLKSCVHMRDWHQDRHPRDKSGT